MLSSGPSVRAPPFQQSYFASYICKVDFELEQKYRKTLEKVGEWTGGEPDLQIVLFLIGVQELGRGPDNFKKDEKVNLMHIAICTLLEPYGYYRRTGLDKDGWPHFEKREALPPLSRAEQDHLIKEAIVDYFAPFTQG